MARSIDDIQRDIERNRTQLAKTLDELSVRTNPKNVADDAKSRAVDGLQEPKVQAALGAVALVIVAGAWWAATGVFEIVAAVRRGSWLLGLAGLASLVLGALVLAFPGPGLLMLVWFAAIQAVLFGVLLMVLPGAGILTLGWLIGIWAVLFGALFVMLAFRLRKAGKLRADPSK